MGKHSGKQHHHQQPKKRQSDDDQEWDAVLKEAKVDAAHQILITAPQSKYSGRAGVWAYGWGWEGVWL